MQVGKSGSHTIKRKIYALLTIEKVELYLLTSYKVNVTAGPIEERMMLSGLHTVTDIYCVCCGQSVGGKYETAHEQSQKYKEGKFVLERSVLFAVRTVINYFMMLALMSFNGGVFVAIVVGLAVGYRLFRNADDEQIMLIDDPCACG
ncbi:yippee-like protein [Tanacetum coccineum]